MSYAVAAIAVKWCAGPPFSTTSHRQATEALSTLGNDENKKNRYCKKKMKVDKSTRHVPNSRTSIPVATSSASLRGGFQPCKTVAVASNPGSRRIMNGKKISKLLKLRYKFEKDARSDQKGDFNETSNDGDPIWTDLVVARNSDNSRINRSRVEDLNECQKVARKSLAFCLLKSPICNFTAWNNEENRLYMRNP
ncbi:unnamed protein product [Soboliphyme baturini]|uniref:Uncharacterized protein n=1 Tax=Soboliphyme baturini TaxID=241478 RepID=A0A183IGN2_9BILA|nr:unnamed protein product [Soboliphyme baturini]